MIAPVGRPAAHLDPWRVLAALAIGFVAIVLVLGLTTPKPTATSSDAGPDRSIIDTCALSDPLLARLPETCCATRHWLPPMRRFAS